MYFAYKFINKQDVIIFSKIDNSFCISNKPLIIDIWIILLEIIIIWNNIIGNDIMFSIHFALIIDLILILFLGLHRLIIIVSILILFI